MQNLFAFIRDQLKKDEGLVLRPYPCPAGKLTIGYGRNLDDRGISQEEAEIMLDNDITLAMIDLDKVLNTMPDIDLSEMRYAALVNMMFNLGLPTFKRFKRMLEALSKQDFRGAANEMLNSRWALQVGPRAERLAVLMREDE